MIKSELILPIRIYDDLYDQRRFNQYCNDSGCDSEILASTDLAPWFQFSRASSLNVCTRLTLRNVCSDGTRVYKLLSEPESNFVQGGAISGYTLNKTQTFFIVGDEESGNVDVPIFDYNDGCGAGLANSDLSILGDLTGATPLTASASIVLHGITATTSYKYRVKLVIPHFVQTSGSSFAIKVWNGAVGDNLLQSITSAGVYVWEFYATFSDLTIEFKDIQLGDEFNIQYLQGTILNPVLYSGYVTDRDISPSKVKITQLANGRDIVVYCEAIGGGNYTPDPGTYYYILEMGPEMYYSETFTLKRPKELEAYYCLEWCNVAEGVNGRCDINNVIAYQAQYTGCVYTNKIYLDASLVNPVYNTQEDEEENGAGEKNITFKRWEKTLSFNVQKCPNHLTDALTGIFLHNFVALSFPLNEKQDVRGDAVEIERVNTEVTDIMEACFQNVKLNLVFQDKYTRSNCCDSLELYECPDDFDAPTITSVSEISSTRRYVVTGTGVPGSMVIIEYQIDSDSYVQDMETSTIVDAGGLFTILFDARRYVPLVAVSLKIRVNNQTLTCDFGTTASQTIYP